MPSEHQMWDRFLARDRAWDGRFLTGVKTTGIYCVASCPARKPKRENVAFFSAEADAVAAGLRPCKRCRPDLVAQGQDPEREIVEAVLRELRERPGDFADVRAVTRRSGYGATRLNELFRLHAHDTVAGVLQRARVASAAEHLLAEQRRPIDVALDAGFESSSTFYEAFGRELGTTPRAWRSMARLQRTGFELPVDFRRDDALGFLARDPESPAEAWDEGTGTYRKAFVWRDRPVALVLRFERGGVTVTPHGRRRWSGEELGALHVLARGLLGLPMDAAAFERRARRVPNGARLVRHHLGLRMARTATLHEALLWAIVGQQVTVQFAAQCRRAVVATVGPAAPLGMTAHPDAGVLADVGAATFRTAKLSRSKGEYVRSACASLADGTLAGLAEGSAVAAEQRLLAVRGVGPWTARYVLMRGLGLPDCAPIGDAGLASGLQRFLGLEARGTHGEIEGFLSPFAPFRTLACAHLWRVGSADAERSRETEEA